ncbi:unnamed protein product [Peronospora destructor]|uniref:Uncharacterized protein n=1 Tax=Peronospora destructor TaxID=86335 RepID=A0AAV0V5U9_9STRA|nr:unnamed protein product [Peronospora destructor]
MKRSFQDVSAVLSDVDDNALSTIDSEPVAVTATSHDTNSFGRPRKHRMLHRTRSSALLAPPTEINGLSNDCNVVFSLTSPFSPYRRCDNLEAALPEEALLNLVVSFLTVREQQHLREINRSWQERVQTLEVDRLGLSAETLPLSARTLHRACRAVMQSYSRVRRLDVSGQRLLTDCDLLVLTSCFWSHLEEIVADDCPEISDVAVLAILNAQSMRLRSVSVRRCKKVTGKVFAGQVSQLTGLHPSLTNLNMDDTSVTCAFVSCLEAHFPTLQQLSALHTPAHRTFFQQNVTLSPLLHELQLLVSNELVELPLLPALLDEFNRWCHSRCRRKAGAFERTVIASGSRALLDIPLLLSGPSDSANATSETEETDSVFISPLLYACASGRTRALQAILVAMQSQQNGTALDLENTDADGHSALSLAVANGLLEATRLLLQAGADVNTRSLISASPLYIASEHGWDVLVDMLLDANAQRDCAVRGGATALCAAAKNGRRSIVLRLLAAEKQAEDELQARGRISKRQLVQALFLACEGGHLFVVSDLLLLTELDANVLMDENVSPLYLACQMGYVDIASLLLKRGANPSFRRPLGGVSCLYIAAQEGHDQIVRLLIKAGTNVYTKMHDMSTALHIAARMGRIAVSRALLQFGARLNDQTRSGLTALYIASEEGHVKLVQFLLEAGAVRDLQTNTGATALFVAVHRGHKAVIKALLLGGANASLAKHNGTSPLDAAALLGDVKTTRLLLRFGARVGGLALHFAERRRNAADLQALLRTRYKTQHLSHGVNTGIVTSIPPATA